ncbi:MAG: 4Fe-4S dicluster domain-containing protein [Chloroflexi bacterium]|nr:4Fe-4S dicluster domain-containing protein [Chloroflexota bacterium]
MKRVFVQLDAEDNPCAGCLTCELACAAEHSGSHDIVLATLENPLPQSRLFVMPADHRAVPVLCRHCQDAPCVDACISGALQKDAVNGIVTNTSNGRKCIGCWMCVMACPYGVIVPGPLADVAVKCDLCPDRETPACVDSCPSGVLIYTDVDDWANRRRQKAVRAPGDH